MFGFYNWKDGTRCFNRHDGTAVHKAAVDFTIMIPAGMSRGVGDMLSTAHAEKKKPPIDTTLSKWHKTSSFWQGKELLSMVTAMKVMVTSCIYYIFAH